MKLIYPKQINQENAESLRLCVAKSGIELSGNEVLSEVSEQLASIEAGVQIIEQKFPVPKVGKVDLIACDRDGNLLLINLNLVLDVQMVSNILRQADWIVNNREVLEHFYFVSRDSYLVSRNQSAKYPSIKLRAGEIRDTNNEMRDIRIWCLAGKVLPEADCLLNHLDSSLQLEVFTYDCLILSGEKWLVVQPYLPCHSRGSGNPVNLNALDPRFHGDDNEIRDTSYEIRDTNNEIRDTRHELTQEEIDDFFSDDEPLQTSGNAVDEEDEITYVGPARRS